MLGERPSTNAKPKRMYVQTLWNEWFDKFVLKMGPQTLWIPNPDFLAFYTAFYVGFPCVGQQAKKKHAKAGGIVGGAEDWGGEETYGY